MERKSGAETLIRAPVIIKNKKMITLELFKPLHSPFIIKWFENPNNRLYQNTKRIDKKSAKELIRSDCNRKVYLIKNDDKPIGYCMIKDIKTNPKVGITIDEPYWGNGYGKEAMKILEKKARKMGIKRLGLLVRIKNKRAIRMYRKLGYEITNYVMEKEL